MFELLSAWKFRWDKKISTCSYIELRQYAGEGGYYDAIKEPIVIKHQNAKLKYAIQIIVKIP